MLFWRQFGFQICFYFPRLSIVPFFLNLELGDWKFQNGHLHGFSLSLSTTPTHLMLWNPFCGRWFLNGGGGGSRTSSNIWLPHQRTVPKQIINTIDVRMASRSAAPQEEEEPYWIICESSQDFGPDRQGNGIMVIALLEKHATRIIHVHEMCYFLPHRCRFP